MSQKPDYLRDCMSDVPGVPIDAFNRSWCMVCTNSGCSRSSANGLAFTRRAENWKDDLFLNVRRASDDDPKYSSIRSKVFKSPVPTHDMSSMAPAPEPKWFTPVAVEEEEAPPDTEPTPETAPEAQVPVPVAEAEPAVQLVPAVGSPNTPFSQGTVLTGSSPQRTDVVMQPGQTYTFGDDE